MCKNSKTRNYVHPRFAHEPEKTLHRVSKLALRGGAEIAIKISTTQWPLHLLQTYIFKNTVLVPHI